MALIDIKQVKHGSRFLADVDGAVEKTAVITEPSEVPSDELIPSETYFNAKLDELTVSMPVHEEEQLEVVEPTTEFTLSTIPNDEPIKLIINGVEYHENAYFAVDRSTGTVVWTGDFPLNNDTVDSIKAKYTTAQRAGFPKAKHIVGMVLAEEGAHGGELETIEVWRDNYTLSDPKDPWSRPIPEDISYKTLSVTPRGLWKRIDKNYNEVDFDPNHGTWAGIRKVTTNLGNALGQFIEIPTTWVKNEVIQSGPYAGCNCWWIADGEAPGFHVHPAFIKPDGTPGKLRVGAYMVTLRDNEQNEDSYDDNSIYVDGKYRTLKSTRYNVLWDEALSYNTEEENGYRVYTIYDHHFIARMILTEFCDPNVMFTTNWHDSTDENIYEMTNGENGWNELDSKPSDAQLQVTTDYHGIQSLLGDTYASCTLYGLTTLNGTYQLLAADGSGTMVETGIPCCDGGTWLTNCYMTKVNGVDFGDVFINDGRNVVAHEYDSNIDRLNLGSFCDFQYIKNDCHVYTVYENEYNYSGLFMLNSAPNTWGGCWRLVQVV